MFLWIVISLDFHRFLLPIMQTFSQVHFNTITPSCFFSVELFCYPAKKILHTSFLDKINNYVYRKL